MASLTRSPIFKHVRPFMEELQTNAALSEARQPEARPETAVTPAELEKLGRLATSVRVEQVLEEGKRFER